MFHCDNLVLDHKNEDSMPPAERVFGELLASLGQAGLPYKNK